ncbi:MAG: hypothetical protein WCW13_00040 [archaeon]|jgi:hypothetical protein
MSKGNPQNNRTITTNGNMRQKTPQRKPLFPNQTKKPNYSAQRAQNKLRENFERMIKNPNFHIDGTRFVKVADKTGSGVDYRLGKIKFDFKFGFGELGERTIKVRIGNKNNPSAKNQLVNEADWIMVMHENKTIEIFSKSALQQYVRMQLGTIAKTRQMNPSKNYDTYSVKLDELYRMPGVSKIVVTGPENSSPTIRTMKKALRKVVLLHEGKSIKHPSVDTTFSLKRMAELEARRKAFLTRRGQNTTQKNRLTGNSTRFNIRRGRK